MKLKWIWVSNLRIWPGNPIIGLLQVIDRRKILKNIGFSLYVSACMSLKFPKVLIVDLSTSPPHNPVLWRTFVETDILLNEMVFLNVIGFDERMLIKFINILSSKLISLLFKLVTIRDCKPIVQHYSRILQNTLSLVILRKWKYIETMKVLHDLLHSSTKKPMFLLLIFRKYS